MDIKAQLVACDAMRYSFYFPFLVMIKHSQIVGKYIRKSYQFLVKVSEDEFTALDVLHGRSLLFGSKFHDENDTNFTKPVGVEVFGTHIRVRSTEYLVAGCKAAAVGLYKISAEYFSNENCDGQYFNDSDHTYSVLSGLEAHSQVW